ncbi:MAG: hypothetical protein KAW89_06385, partial [Armatimonadetes bacterium]|nr:hypothetical protein [Armatimonadota bacterium]
MYMPNWAFKSLAVVGAMLLATILVAQEETLLSRNATYQLAGQGYTYTGQVMPGTNLRPKGARFVATPLVEGTDSGDLLIDGKTDRSSMVYTPWYWSAQWKQIIVTMTLPGPSKVSRVTVHLPPQPGYQPEAVMLSVRAAEGEWQEVERLAAESPDRTPQAWTYRLAGVGCDQLKVTASEGDKAHIGIAEIEVYGEGPTESTTRGLIRSTPHIETISEPQPSTPPGSSLLTRPGETTVTLSGTPLTSGEAGMLVDGDRTTLVRIDSKPHQHPELTADIDLGNSYLIEAVNVWMPGGQGRATGHIHDLMVAISPDAEGGLWQTPIDLVVNPYWPSDEAPRPYVIPISNLSVVGQQVRVTVTLSGTGGVTNRLAMAEVEVWGRAVPEGTPTPVPFDMRPVQFEPEPMGQLPPKLQWLTTNKVRGAWIGDDLFDKFPGSDKTKAQVLVDSGFTLVRVSMGIDRSNRDTSPAIANRLPPNVAEARRVGIP